MPAITSNRDFSLKDVTQRSHMSEVQAITIPSGGRSPFDGPGSENVSLVKEPCDTVAPAKHTVSVARHSVRWDNPGHAIGQCVKAIIDTCVRGSFYLNPEFTVSCSAPTPEFFQRLRVCKRRWGESLARVVGRFNRRRILDKAGASGGLVLNGVLIVDGRYIEQRYWRRLEHESVLNGLAQEANREKAEMYRSREWASRHKEELSIADDGLVKWKQFHVSIVLDNRRL
jgi:hypothetical protein